MKITQAQCDFHWKRWGAVTRLNRWVSVDGRLHPEAVKVGNGDWHKRVWAFADLIARQRHGGITADDLRKGCYTMALGEPKSLTRFENDDLDRVLIAFRLLEQPDDLKAVSDFCAYERFDDARRAIAQAKALGIPCPVSLPDDPGERRRHLFFVGTHQPGYVKVILRDRFAGKSADDLCLADLRRLTATLKNRPNGRKWAGRESDGGHRPPLQVASENIPF